MPGVEPPAPTRLGEVFWLERTRMPCSKGSWTPRRRAPRPATSRARPSRWPSSPRARCCRPARWRCWSCATSSVSRPPRSPRCCVAHRGISLGAVGLGVARVEDDRRKAVENEGDGNQERGDRQGHRRGDHPKPVLVGIWRALIYRLVITSASRPWLTSASVFLLMPSEYHRPSGYDRRRPTRVGAAHNPAENQLSAKASTSAFFSGAAGNTISRSPAM